MKCTILGSGGSNGVPKVACECFVCNSKDPKNKRYRVSILIESEKTKLLIDTSPDLRMQALHNNINYVDAVLYTHAHADHVMGINDVKFLSKDKKTIPAYMSRETFEVLKKQFNYIFFQSSDLYAPILTAKLFSTYFKIGDIDIIPFKQKHGEMYSHGFRFSDLAYSTDVNQLGEDMVEALQGIEIWVVDCLRYCYAPTHSYLEKTLYWISRIKPKLAILTHMAHEIEYNELKSILPSNVVPAYDGMTINF